MSQSTPTPDTTVRTETAGETVTVPAGLDLRERMALHLAKQCFDSIPSGEEARLGDVIAVALGAWDKALALSPQHPVGVREALDEDVARRLREVSRTLRSGAKAVALDYGNLARDIDAVLATLSHPPAQDAPGAVDLTGLLPRHVEELRVHAAKLRWQMEHDERPVPEHGWTCFHCAQTFTTTASASAHFGNDPLSGRPACCATTRQAVTRAVAEWADGPCDNTEELVSSILAALDPSPPLPKADGEVVAYRWRYEDQPDNWSYSRQKPRLASLPNVVCEPLVRQSALVSALRERDEARAYGKAASDAITSLTAGGSEYFGKRIGDFYTADLPFCVERIRESKSTLFSQLGEAIRARREAEAAREKAEQVAAYADERMGLAARLLVKDSLTPEERCFDALAIVNSTRAALRASTEEGKTATPSVKDEEAGR